MSSLKKIALIVIAIALILITISGASAISVEEKNPFLISPGESVESQLIIYDIPFNSSLTVSSSGNYLDILDEEYVGDIMRIPFSISIPNETYIDIYQEKIIIESGNETWESEIDIFVQKTWFIFLPGIMENIYFIIFVILLMIVLIISNYWKMLKNKIKNKSLIIMIIIISLVIGCVVIYMETNLFVNHPGDTVSKKINLDIEGDGLITLQMVRNEETPETLDWITFKKTNTTYMLYSLDENADNYFDTIIEIPSIVEKGKYFYDIKIIEEGKEEEVITKGISVY